MVVAQNNIVGSASGFVAGVRECTRGLGVWASLSLLLTLSQIKGLFFLVLAAFITNLDGFVQKSQHKVLTIGVISRTGQTVALKQSQSVGRYRWTGWHGYVTEMRLQTVHVVGGSSRSSGGYHHFTYDSPPDSPPRGSAVSLTRLVLAGLVAAIAMMTLSRARRP